MGMSADLSIRAFDGGLDQIWKISGSQTKYTITTPSGSHMHHAGSGKFHTDMSPTNMTIQVTEVASVRPALMLFFSDGTWGRLSEKADYTINVVTATNNPASALNFIPISIPVLPVMDEWYYIEFASGVLQDTGSGLTIAAKIAGNNGQTWKLSGSVAELTLESEFGRKLTFDSEFFGIADNSDALFSLIPNQTAGKTQWELKYKFNQSDYDADVKYVLSASGASVIAEMPHKPNNFFALTSTTSGTTSPTINDPVVSVKYYNLEGIEVQPVKGMIYIVKKTYASQRVTVSKEF